MVFGAKTFAKKGFLIERKLMEWRCFSLVTAERSWDFVVQDDRAARSVFVVVQILRTGAAGGKAHVGALLWHVARMRLHRRALETGRGLHSSLAAVVLASAADMQAHGRDTRRGSHSSEDGGDELTESETMLTERGLRASDLRQLTRGVDAVLMTTDAAGAPVQSSGGTVRLSLDAGETSFGTACIGFESAPAVESDPEMDDTAAELAPPEGTPPLSALEESDTEEDKPEVQNTAASAARRGGRRKKKSGGMFCCSAPSRDDKPAPPRPAPAAPVADAIVQDSEVVVATTATDEDNTDETESEHELPDESEEELPTTPPAHSPVDLDEGSEESDLDVATPLKLNSESKQSLDTRPQVLQVVHSFAPVRKTDLALNIGDLVVVTNSDPEKTWWTGYLQHDPRQSGDFPFNYVEDIDDIVGAQLELEQMHMEMREHATRRLQVVHSFAPVRKTDLALNIGDLVVVTNSDPEKTWWTGYLQHDPRQSGDFPFNYVEDIDDIVGAQLELEQMHMEMREHATRRGSNLARRIDQKLLASAFFAWRSSNTPLAKPLPPQSVSSWSNQSNGVDGESEQALHALVQSLGAASPASRATYQQLLYTIQRKTREQEKAHRLQLLLPYLTRRRTARNVSEVFAAWTALAHQQRRHNAVVDRSDKRRMRKFYAAWRSATSTAGDSSLGVGAVASSKVRTLDSLAPSFVAHYLTRVGWHGVRSVDRWEVRSRQSKTTQQTVNSALRKHNTSRRRRKVLHRASPVIDRVTSLLMARRRQQ